MSKRALKKYLQGLEKEQLEDQIIDLYERFKEVKTFYNFVFNPKEEKLMDECKFKISKEYFPLNSRKPKLRRSVAQKYIRHFIQIGVEPHLVADVMLYTIEIAQTFSAQKHVKADSFYKSIANSFEQAMEFILSNGLYKDFENRLQKVLQETEKQDWINADGFERIWNEQQQKFSLE